MSTGRSPQSPEPPSDAPPAAPVVARDRPTARTALRDLERTQFAALETQLRDLER